MSIEIGQIIGDYQIVAPLGAGGMGCVFKVRNVISDRLDAMKVLLPDISRSSDLAERFLQEIKLLAGMHHPNIAALYTALRLDNQLVMIMEFVDGTNLDELLRSGAIPIARSVSIISQVLSALAYAHSHGVVHRDIKPANIAISSDGTVKLLDFGVARGGSDRRLTVTGMVLGSLYYMSPEQVYGQPADARSDLYSVGITLYRMLTGKRPIDGNGEFEVMRAQAGEMPPPPEKWNPAIPESLSAAVMKALAKVPEQRFQSAEDFRSALEPFLAGTPVSTAFSANLGRTVTEPGTQMLSTSVFHAAALNSLQKHLAQILGPIAGPLVRKASKNANSLDDLCRLVAEQIPEEADRRKFLSACAAEFGPFSAGEPARVETVKTPRPVAWDPNLLERAKKALAEYIGPLARVVVDRSAKKANSAEELYSMLSAEIPGAKDREKFLASCGHIR